MVVCQLSYVAAQSKAEGQNTSAWKILPELVILADTVDTFKNWLDKFWKNQDMVYDYKSDLNWNWQQKFD